MHANDQCWISSLITLPPSIFETGSLAVPDAHQAIERAPGILPSLLLVVAVQACPLDACRSVRVALPSFSKAVEALASVLILSLFLTEPSPQPAV